MKSLNKPAFMKPTSLPRSSGGAQCAIITVILGHITPCASPTMSRKSQSSPQWMLALHGINIVTMPDIIIAKPKINRAP